MVKSFINKFDPRVKNMFLVAGAAYVGRFGQVLVMLITLPIAREELTAELFGVWAAIMGFMNFMAFADIGAGNAVLNGVANANATKNYELMGKVIKAGYSITIFSGILIALGWFAWFEISENPSQLLGSINYENHAEVTNSLKIFFLILACNIPAALIQKIQLGAQEGYINGINQLASSAFTLILVPLVFYFGGGVPWLVGATIGVQLFVNVLNTIFWLFKSNVKFKSASFDKDSFNQLKIIAANGAMFLILQLAVAFAFQSDVLVITHVLGASAYGEFAIIQKIFFVVSALIGTSISGLWPLIGDAISSGDRLWAVSVFFRSLKLSIVLGTVSVTVLLFAMPTIIEFWIGDSIQPTFLLLMLFAIWTVVELAGTVVGAFFNGANIIRPQIIIASMMAIAAFGLKLILTEVYGLSGAVLSTLLAYTVIAIPSYVYLIKRNILTA